jgi:DNA-binding HxlR family transcriptional regulator
MTRREFGEYCGLSRALELVGERWTLLIVRELLTHSCRYTDLLEALPGIPTNVLSTRLKELEQAGLAERQIAPAPQRAVVYTLTPAGQQLEAAVLTLARWGTTQLGEKRTGEVVPPSTLAMTLRAAFNRGAAQGLTASWELRAAGATLYAVVTDGQLATGVGPAPAGPDLVITIPADQVPTYQEILESVTTGQAELSGKRKLGKTFLLLFTPEQAQ